MKSSSTFLNIFFVLLFVYFLIVIFLFFYQRKLLYHPGENNYLDDASLNHNIEKVYIPSDQRLVAWHFKKNSKFKTLLFFHGNAGKIDNRIYKLNEFSKLDINYLIFAYRGFSGNLGKPNEKGLYDDARSAVKWLESNGIKKEKVILYGESLGTAVAVEIAQNENFAGMILESPFTSMIEMGKKYYFFFPVSLLLKDRYESIKKIKNVHFPIMVMHGKRDRIVPFAMGKKIYDLANLPKFYYFSKYDDHMMDYNNLLLEKLKIFIKSLN